MLAFRGTMGLDDLFLTDGGDIVVDGVASSQVIGAEHYFIIEEIAATSCRFINGGTMSGIITDRLWPAIERATPA